MIGIDTNVLMRYFTQDDPRQSKAAQGLLDRKLTRDNPGHIAAITLAEFAWVLKRLYAGTREEIADAIQRLLTAPTLLVEHKTEVWKARRDYRTSTAGFSDCLIAQVNLAAGCEATYTFARAASKVTGFKLTA